MMNLEKNATILEKDNDLLNVVGNSEVVEIFKVTNLFIALLNDENSDKFYTNYSAYDEKVIFERY